MPPNIFPTSASLPPGWSATTLGEFVSDRAGGLNPLKFPHECFELYSVPSFDGGRPEFLEGSSIGSNKQLVETNAVLLCKINPRINRAWVVGNFSAYRRIASTEWIPFAPSAAVVPAYLCFYLQQDALRDYAAANASGVGGSLMRVKASTFTNFRFTVAPLPEQHRIVAEIERQFSLLDAGVVNLKRVQASLKRYRAAVLQAACTGQLIPTEADTARAEGRPYEPADVLLTRILGERRARWEAEQLAKMEAQGKLPLNGAWKAKYQEPAAPDARGLPELPEGWGWIGLGQLANDSGYGTSEKCDYAGAGYPVLRIPNIARGAVDLNDLKHALSKSNINSAEALALGDLLIVRTNGSKSLIGRGAVVKTVFQQPHYFASYLIRFRLLRPLDSYVSSIWHSPHVRNWVERTAATSAGQYNISMSALSGLALPLPPIAEQERIVAEVERRLSVVDNLEQVVKANLKRAERLRQAVLKEAFTGRLVPQDPADEPASILLERIKAERNALYERMSGKINRRIDLHSPNYGNRISSVSHDIVDTSHDKADEQGVFPFG